MRQRSNWGVMAGDTCTYTFVTKDNEAKFFKDKPDPKDMIGSVAKASTVSKELEGNWSECLKAAGVEPESLEDPNAPTPPEDGVTTIEEFQGGIAGAKSRWLNKTLTIEGVVNGVSTTTSGDAKTTIVSIKTSTDAEGSCSCTLSDASQAEGRKQGDVVRVTGKANDNFRGGLSECSILAQK